MNLGGYEQGEILRETMNNVRANLGDAVNELTLERVAIGVFFTGVKLSNGQGGLCFTPIKDMPEAVCCPSSARMMPSSGQLQGKRAVAVLEEMFTGKVLKKALGIAVLNALSATCWQLQPPPDYVITRGIDAFDNLIIPESGHTVIVGALTPMIKKLKTRKSSFCILEMDPRTLKADELPFYKATERAPEELPKADLVIITGTTLINDTLEDLLKLTKPGADILVVGPTASMLPDALFRRGVNLVGGTLVTQPDELLDILVEAGSGYHFYGKAAERVVIHR